MNPIRVKFKAQSSVLETLLEEYKNSHPKNFSAMIRAGLPIFMILFSVLFAIDALINGASDESIANIFVSVVLFFFGLVMYVKFYRFLSKDDSSSAEKNIDAMITDFKEYPDVQNYVKKCQGDLLKEKAHKRKIKMAYYIVFGGFLAFFGLKLLIGLGINLSHFFKKDSNEAVFNSKTLDGFYVALDLQDDVPFLSLKPLKKDISGNIRLEAQTLDVYLNDFIDKSSQTIRILSAMTPEISGKDSTDFFRITITDKNGNPIERCPRFSFSGSKSGIISTYAFCYDVSTNMQCSFQTLQVLRYLQANKDDLRFLVEKIN